ncbi:MAG: HU family DNA-binding protein [Deltaproteobacteria bacterium]|nr:HU family DNA-binding protein [Deltaproteobacteria bacterium]
MNKADLIKEVAEIVSSRQTAGDVVDCILKTIQGALERGERVSVSGFGSFTAEQRAARKARNPRTGEEIEVEAKRVPRFVPGDALKQAVNDEG